MIDVDILLRKRESETLEFKERFNTDVIETAVAFANTRGGYIVIGVNNDGKPAKQQHGDEALRDYITRIVNATEPIIIPSAERYTIDKSDIIVLQISEVPLKPVSTRGRCYCRSGSTTRTMTPSEIAQMHLASTGQSMDAIIVDNKTIDDLDLEAVRRYIQKASLEGRRNFASDEDPWRVLLKLELVKSETEITRAALLLFGKNPQSPLSQAVVHAGRLRGQVHMMDSRVIDGTLLEQVEETIAFIKKNISVRFEITGEPERVEIWDYPLIALREAVINAICHRDYGDITDIQIKIFEEKMVIWSPGFLPYNVSLDDLLNPMHASRPRNKLIAQIFFDLGLIERYGGGIQRIFDDCEEAGLRRPIFEHAQGGLRVTFFAYEFNNEGVSEGVHEGVSEGVHNLFNLIYKEPGLRTPALAEKLNTSPKNIERWLKQLKDEGKIEFRGIPKSGGYWPLMLY